MRLEDWASTGHDDLQAWQPTPLTADDITGAAVVDAKRRRRSSQRRASSVAAAAAVVALISAGVVAAWPDDDGERIHVGDSTDDEPTQVPWRFVCHVDPAYVLLEVITADLDLGWENFLDDAATGEPQQAFIERSAAVLAPFATEDAPLVGCGTPRFPAPLETAADDRIADALGADRERWRAIDDIVIAIGIAVDQRDGTAADPEPSSLDAANIDGMLRQIGMSEAEAVDLFERWQAVR